MTEFEVEKIKRDVKITCIYEGTSEIQQSIISTFRWKETRKTKGEFYAAICREMEDMDKDVKDAGCRFYGLSAGILNNAIMLVHDNRLMRQQHVMFSLADMMTYVEVGASLARKAVALSKSGDPEAKKMKAMSRIFADEVVQLVSRNALNILMGSGVFHQKAAYDFMETNSYDKLVLSSLNVINDMDLVADILFGR
jgi:alkylation response protein AidB-like acyl-CoA dehydrogenase